MDEWCIKSTDTFLKHIKKHKNNHELLLELDVKIKRLKENPFSIGGNLAGFLHGLKSTRLARKYRLVFSVDQKNKIVYFHALDHRKDVYD
ncbi:hypothetical protein HYY69_00015 [Candidatus Woesearchaeota archaeon]|nr:hypothetical protein [Candidatus Woesearchaeota archaeon]